MRTRGTILQFQTQIRESVTRGAFMRRLDDANELDLDALVVQGLTRGHFNVELARERLVVAEERQFFGFVRRVLDDGTGLGLIECDRELRAGAKAKEVLTSMGTNAKACG